MKLGTKIMLASAGAVILATLGSVFTVYTISKRNRVNELRRAMSNEIKQAEVVRGQMEAMHKAKVFDYDSMHKEAAAYANGRPLKEVVAQTSLYKTIPIVAAWQSLQDLAKADGFQFYTPTRPGVPARNPRNDNGAQFAAAFRAFERGDSEYFLEDKDQRQLILARPVRLTESCLACHGDPATSATGNGLDPIGQPMEGLKAGDLKGAFVLVAPMTQDKVIMASMKNMAIVGTLILIVVVVGFYFLNRAMIVRPLSATIATMETASDDTSAASTEVSRASQSLAEGATEQAASLQQTSASLEEMASMTKQNADNASAAKQLAKDARTAADNGVKDMQLMVRAMEDIKVSSDDIAKILKTIDEIAFQTNLLALNAAVEAAHAGDAGRGFAVVADEVRVLAQRSAVAAKETAVKIEGAISRTSQGVQISSQVAATLEDIASKARRVDELIAEVAAGSGEQSKGIEQINIAVSQMDRVTQSNAAGAEESASAAGELDAQADCLRRTVGELFTLVHGRTNAGQGTVRNTLRQDEDGPTEREPLRQNPARAGSRVATTTMSAVFSPEDYGPERPVPDEPQGAGLIQWDPDSMSTGVDSIDAQHQELIANINKLHQACLEGKGREELLKMTDFLGDYATRHFAHEEGVMEEHRCPVRTANKAAHAKFLRDYAQIVEALKRDGPNATVILKLKDLVGDWLKSHICSIDSKLRECSGVCLRGADRP
ncbi:MAG TPA: bacteriohemerythrin [Verrucomicrobiae bacterium]|nr:bacteriohemerythrin [Verrucomicrobiae bacterium]